MAVRWCAVGGATTQHAWSASPSANVSSNGAALLSVKTAKSLWIYTPAKLRNEPSGWTRPETWPSSVFPCLPQDLMWTMVFWDMMSILHGSSPWSLFLVAWLYYNSVKALQLKKKKKNLHFSWAPCTLCPNRHITLPLSCSLLYGIELGRGH